MMNLLLDGVGNYKVPLFCCFLNDDMHAVDTNLKIRCLLRSDLVRIQLDHAKTFILEEYVEVNLIFYPFNMFESVWPFLLLTDIQMLFC